MWGIQRLMVLYGKRNQHKKKKKKNENTMKCRNYIFMNQKFQPAVIERKKWRESSPISVFSPLNLQSFHTLGNWLGFCVKVLGFFFCRENVAFLVGWWCIFIPSFRRCLWPVFRWEEGLGPFRCYFYDLVYYVLCLGKGLVAFCMILEIELFFLYSCCLWSL